jgi:hypothetical protein
MRLKVQEEEEEEEEDGTSLLELAVFLQMCLLFL